MGNDTGNDATATRRRTRFGAGLLALAMLVGVTVVVANPGSAQGGNPLPGVWYGVRDGDDAHVTTIVFGDGPASSTPFVIVDLIPVGCGQAPEILVGRARLTADSVVFGASTRYCPNGSTLPVGGFPMDYAPGVIDSVTPALEPVELQRVCPRSVDEVFAGRIVGAIVGTDGTETLRGTPGNDLIDALAGDDTVNAGGGNDIVCGGDGNDTLRGGAGVDVIWGAGNADVLFGNGGGDVVLGGVGNDRIVAGGGNDFAWGEAGADTIGGGPGSDLLDAGGGNDTVTGNGGNDTMLGGGGRDDMNGGTGSDNANGGRGSDRCIAETRTSCER